MTVVTLLLKCIAENALKFKKVFLEKLNKVNKVRENQTIEK